MHRRDEGSSARFDGFHRRPAGALIRAAAAALAFNAAVPAASHAQHGAAFRQTVRTAHSAEAFRRETAGRVTLERRLDPRHVAAARDAAGRLPVARVTVSLEQGPGLTWLGTREGAIRVDRSTGAVEYFAGRRWLPDDHVTGIGVDGEAVWIETPNGLSRIEYRPMTLADKSRLFVERVQARHNRWGLTAGSRLRVPGDLSTNLMVSDDNDGLWTAMYVAAECFRYKVTGDADARENARRGMQAIVRLEAITGIPGFPARSFIRIGEEPQPSDGEWHDTPDGGWRWKGDTSSDEIVGHYFVYPIYYDLVADEEERSTLRGVIERMTSHILDNGYQLIDADGLRTRWGWWGPEAIWDDPDETGLRALHMLSHLRVALHMTASPARRARYQAAYDDLIGTHKYHLLTRNQKIMVPGSINHSDDELAFLSYYPLLMYEKDPRLREVYRHSLDRSWRVERPERNPLWNFIYAVGAGAREFDREASLRTLREIPLDQVRWDVRNSHRGDVPIDASPDRHGRVQGLVVLPYGEAPVWKWNANPYALDGGAGGLSEEDGVYFLLPYWMGRFHQLIPE